MSTPDDDVTAELEHLRAENAQLKRTASEGVILKVSEPSPDHEARSE